MDFRWIATAVGEHVDDVVDDAVERAFPSGVYGCYGSDVGGIEQYRHAVGCANAYGETIDVGDECVGVGE